MKTHIGQRLSILNSRPDFTHYAGANMIDLLLRPHAQRHKITLFLEEAELAYRFC